MTGQCFVCVFQQDILKSLSYTLQKDLAFHPGLLLVPVGHEEFSRTAPTVTGKIAFGQYLSTTKHAQSFPKFSYHILLLI